MDPNYSEPLVVPAILCSDLVVREAGTGKLTLAGVFSGWQSPSFPYKTPPFWITVFSTNFAPGTTDANIVIRLEQLGGLVLASAAAQVKFPDGKVDQKTMVEIPFRMNSMMLPEPGTYRVVVLTNDEKLAERPMLVQLSKPFAEPKFVSTFQLNLPMPIITFEEPAAGTFETSIHTVEYLDIPESFDRAIEEANAGLAVDFDEALKKPFEAE